MSEKRNLPTATAACGESLPVGGGWRRREALELVAQLHSERHLADRGAVARQLDHHRAASAQAVGHDADTPEGPHRGAERRVVEEGGDGKEAVRLVRLALQSRHAALESGYQ